MEFCATIKATQFLKIRYNADNIDEADAKAAYYSQATQLCQMPEYGTKWDYQVRNSDGEVLIDWDN